jgi:hypothetical protein
MFYSKNFSISINRHVFKKILKLSMFFFISNFRSVLNAVCFLLGNSLGYEMYTPTFRNTLSHLHRQVGVSCIYYIVI